MVYLIMAIIGVVGFVGCSAVGLEMNKTAKR